MAGIDLEVGDVERNILIEQESLSLSLPVQPVARTSMSLCGLSLTGRVQLMGGHQKASREGAKTGVSEAAARTTLRAPQATLAGARALHHFRLITERHRRDSNLSRMLA